MDGWTAEKGTYKLSSLTEPVAPTRHQWSRRIRDSKGHNMDTGKTENLHLFALGADSGGSDGREWMAKAAAAAESEYTTYSDGCNRVC